MTSVASIEDIIAPTKQTSDIEDSCSDEDADGSEEDLELENLPLPTEFPLATKKYPPSLLYDDNTLTLI